MAFGDFRAPPLTVVKKIGAGGTACAAACYRLPACNACANWNTAMA